jgi:hypothetical protein
MAANRQWWGRPDDVASREDLGRPVGLRFGPICWAAWAGLDARGIFLDTLSS